MKEFKKRFQYQTCILANKYKKSVCNIYEKWFYFSDKRNINTLQPSIGQILDFLTALYESGFSYSPINTARSALSAYGICINGKITGFNVTVVRFLRGVFNLRPLKSRYCKTWDVSKVLTYLQKLSPVKYISLKRFDILHI